MIEYICELEDARYEMTWAPKEEIVLCRDCRLQDEFKYCERLGFKVGDYGYCAGL